MLPDLKLDIPELEPDPVLLEQLSQLSAASVAPSVSGPARSFVAGATVVVVGGFSWLTGTLPGVASPFHRDDHPAPRHAPAEPGQSDDTPGDESGDDSGEAPAVPPGQVLHPNKGKHNGQTKPHQNNGNHTGQDDDATDATDDATDDESTDNGNHTGQTKPHQDNGNHTGQTKPHQNNGNHTGQTKHHQNNGNHTGQTKPHHNNGNHTGQTKPPKDKPQLDSTVNGHVK